MSETCIKFGEHGARVKIENKDIQHYAVHVDPAKKEISCWIASEEGKMFSIEWLELDVEYPSACHLYLDGHCVGRIRRESHSAKPITFRRGFVSQSSVAPFLFSKLVVTDDDAYLDTPSRSIGEIKLVVVRTAKPTFVIGAKKQHTIYRDPVPLAPHLQKVHERSKKAIAHQVKYGSEIPARKKEVCFVKTVETLVTFIFKYRPLEMLHANDIVPRNPEPLKLREHALDTLSTSETSSGKPEGDHFKVKKAEFGSDTDDEDSIREKALLAEVERIRKGRQLKDSERQKKFLKKEDRPFFTPGEIIDLT